MSKTRPTTPATEHRCLGTEIRAKRSDAGITLTGYAAKYNAMSDDLGGFREIIKPGAFRRAVEEKQDVRLLFNHESDNILARTKSGTMTLEDDAVGLRFEAKLPDTQLARDLATSVERGDIDGMSFGFKTVRDEWEFKTGGEIRHLLDVDLFDIGPVTFPAYPDTDVAKRSQQDLREQRDRALATRRARQRQAETEITLTAGEEAC
jgi:HK97 family phage prohead protease